MDDKPSEARAVEKFEELGLTPAKMTSAEFGAFGAKQVNDEVKG